MFCRPVLPFFLQHLTTWKSWFLPVLVLSSLPTGGAGALGVTAGSEETGLLVLGGGQGLGAMDELGLGCGTSLVGCGSLLWFEGHAAGGALRPFPGPPVRP